MSTFFQFKSLVAHWLDRVDEHSIHSPFYFDFYNKIIRGKTSPEKFAAIEETRQRLLGNHSLITVNDLGAPSSYFKSNQREIAKVAATSLSSRRFCEFYHRILQSIEAERVLELGSSLGITALYLSANEGTKVYTFEGNESIIQIAKTNFESFERKNIKLIEGNLDETLGDFLQDPTPIDFALMDANHRYEPTMRYFHLISRRMSDRGIIVVDDIHLSEDMAKAWQEMKDHDLVYGSIDLYKCGILFFDLSLTKQHFVFAI